MNPNNETKENVNTDANAPFSALASLPKSISEGQCVTYNDEILICGGFYKSACYSYHTTKNQYKFICSYPDNIELEGHCVVKYLNGDDPNTITLLCFGGQYKNEKKHTFVMKYLSVWNNEEKKVESENSGINEWLPFIGNNNEVISIGRMQDEYCGVRGLIGGSKNHLLFITYYPSNIDVFDLNTCKYLKHDNIPVEAKWISYHCFVSKNGNQLSASKERKYEMMLFCKDIGFSIEYDEDNNTFEFQKLRVCTTIRPFKYYAYVQVNDVILLFGGCGYSISKLVYKYFIKEDQWMQSELGLPISLWGAAALLNADNTCVHILGGRDESNTELSTHLKTSVATWMKEETTSERQWILDEEERQEIEDIKAYIDEMKQNFNIQNLKVEFFLFFFIFFSNCNKLPYSALHQQIITKKKKKKREKNRFK
ncbi:hypothetical protein RFI_16802 [Reticulomyxa filosa]|uniref:Kelch motif family protein n=1 Tax=Reticulomyxa filosa TaxID=46433 RepID=X6N538_RETFI|nr:hypothetical protein RFI_16802 [Reticulomyxa filosa]|eukprot:ETO20412.1 hypothetical protein RFI_16802 [Reticulomyxa filosa]